MTGARSIKIWATWTGSGWVRAGMEMVCAPPAHVLGLAEMLHVGGLLAREARGAFPLPPSPTACTRG